MTLPESPPTDAIEQVAQALVQARRDRRPADASALDGLLASPEDAYRVQQRVARMLQPADNGFPRHWKSGGPSRTAALTHAPLPAACVWTSPAKAGDLHFNQRLIEAEVALRLARPVTPQQAAALQHDDLAGLVDALTVSIEVVDSRWQQANDAPALLKLADLQSHAALVLGDWVRYVPRDWSKQRCRVTIGDAPPREFTGTHSLGDPAWLLPLWLKHATRLGATVPPRTVVTTGTWCGMLPAQAGDLVRVEFDGIGAASVQL